MRTAETALPQHLAAAEMGTPEDWVAAAVVYPKHFVILFAIEMCYAGLFAIAALWLAMDNAGDEFMVLVWVYLIFGIPW